MGITNSTLQAIAHAAVGDMHAAVAAVRKVRDHASALRETATDRHSEVVQKRKEKEKEVLQAREQVCAISLRCSLVIADLFVSVHIRAISTINNGICMVNATSRLGSSNLVAHPDCT